ncbi:MAG: efflux transporter outer membrane subunit [Geobacteraceae bacterium]|nr:efflux transporter outer membrane subunit [Geobacteraceae bacterium]
MKSPLEILFSAIHKPALTLFLALMAATMPLGGCARLPIGISPKAHMINADTLNAGSTIRETATGKDFQPTTDWWRAYADPQLDRLVEEATAGNPSLRIAQALVARAQFLAAGAKAPLMPEINASAVFTREQFSENHFYRSPYAGDTYWNNQATLDLFYDLDLWGKNRAALASALDTVLVATAEARKVELGLQTAVVRTYISLSLHYILRDIAKTTLRQREEILSITEKRLAAGLATEIERSQAETPVPAAHAELERIEETIVLLCTQLSTLTGKGPGDGEKILRPVLSLHTTIGVPSSLPADLVGRRPDVAAQRWRAEAEAENIKVAKAAFYPNINIAAFIGWQAIGFSKFFSGTSLTHGISPALSLPIFEGSRLRSQLGATTADYDMAVEAYNLTLLQALQEISNELVTLRSLDKQRNEAIRAENLAENAYGIALRGYHSGLTDYLSVLNAQNQTLVEATRTAQIEARRHEAYALLMQALGGGTPVDAASLSAKTALTDKP